MTSKSIHPIGAFIVGPNGHVKKIQDTWPSLGAAGYGTYRWIHFDMSDAGLGDWLHTHLPTGAAGALMQSETRPRCSLLDDGLILNLRGVNLNPGANPEDMVSLRLWVTDSLIVSVRRRKIWAVDDLRLKMENGVAPASVGAFLFELANGLTRRIEKVSLDLEEQTDILEERMIDQPTGLSADIAPLRLQVIKLRRFVRPQKEALVELAATRLPLLDKLNRTHMHETTNRSARTIEELDSTRDRLAAIQEHLDAVNAASMGKNGYLLSLVAAIFLPLGFLTGLFGVNVGGMPGLNWPYAFLSLSVATVAIAVVLYLLFRFSKWL